PARPATGKSRSAVAVPRDPRADTRAARAHSDSGSVDLQLRLRPLSPGRRHLDARVVHGAARRARLASDTGHRSVWRSGDRSSQSDGLRIAGDAHHAPGKLTEPALADPLLRRADSARTEWADLDGALLDRSVDRGDGGGLRIWRRDDTRTRSTQPDLHHTRRVSDHTLFAAPNDRWLRRSPSLACEHTHTDSDCVPLHQHEQV